MIVGSAGGGKHIMIFHSVGLGDAHVLTLEPFSDSRGFFARAFCAEEFTGRGLVAAVNQCNLSFNPRRGTLRGLHYLLAPAREAKLIRCTRGSIFDVIVDTRAESPTYLQHFCVELSAENRKSLYVPPQFAHGYQTLTDDAEVFYQVGDTYIASLERGMRWDDPALNIPWPLAISEISKKDEAWPILSLPVQISFGQSKIRHLQTVSTGAVE